MTRKIVIMGDSHSEAVVAHFRKFLRADFEVCGGQLRLGREWAAHFHRGTDPLCFVREEARENFRRFVAPLGLNGENVLDINVPIFLSLVNIHQAIYYPEWCFYSPVATEDRQFMSRQMFDGILAEYFSHVLEFFEKLVRAGKTVYAIISPGVRDNDDHAGELFLEFRRFFHQEFEARGIPVIDATEATCDRFGVLREEYWVADPEDRVHANILWGKHVADICLDVLKVPGEDG